jgi:hypothetical protein
MTTTEVSQATIDKLDRRFQEALERVPVLRQRADDEGVKEVRELADLVPVLFPHTVYKSYPAQLVEHGRWAQMNRWLTSVSAVPVDVDVDGVADVDGWLDRLASAGHFVSASSGTTGKSSFLNKSEADLTAARESHMGALAQGGVLPDNSWVQVSLSPAPTNILSERMASVLRDNYASSDPLPRFEGTPQTEGPQAYMARFTRLRRAMAEGTADPDEVAAMEAESAQRQEESERRLRFVAEQVLARKDERFLFGTMMALAWRFSEALRDLGAKPGDLTGDNAIFMAGGTKGAVLPDDAEARIVEMLGIAPERFVQMYSMQEINTGMARCPAGRYHVRDQLVLLVLDEPGEQLAPITDGQVEGRAAYFDFSVDARWGGIISGDKIRADYTGCPCGRPGTTVFPDIVRFANLVDGDKITCAGTMDAYVRGFVNED